MIRCQPVTAETLPLLNLVRDLFIEYEQFLGTGHICVADFATELERLPGAYGPPGGTLLLALEDAGTPAGCLALRTITIIEDVRTGELKRMWVRPAFRGRGVGQLLIENALDAARALGLKTVHLDTVPSMMQAAVDLYLRNGFIECERYNANSAPGARFFCREL